MTPVILSGISHLVLAPGAPPAPWRDVSERPNDRYGRMSPPCKLALAVVEKLQLACAPEVPAQESFGIVLVTNAGCLDTDLRYLEERAARRASPLLFTYTLPSCPAAELSIRYRLGGPALTLLATRDQLAAIALDTATDQLGSGAMDSCLCVEIDTGDHGTAATVLLLESPAAGAAAGRRPTAHVVPLCGPGPTPPIPTLAGLARALTSGNTAGGLSVPSAWRADGGHLLLPQAPHA